MNTQPQTLEPLPREGRDLSLWAAVLGAPTLWLCHLQLSYMLVPWCCASGKRWVLHGVSLFFLLLTLGGGALALREFRNAGSPPSSERTSPPLGRTALLSVVGMMSCGLFFLAILFQAIASFILDPCVD
jgi:hypothetical protein